MISLIVPTRNRAYALRDVLDTFYTQKSVREIIFIDDDSTDKTSQVIESFAKKYPVILTLYFKNETRMGASYGRGRALELATSEYVLFCDDDEFMGPDYASECLNALLNNQGDIISGRHLYRHRGEDYHLAIQRFGFGLFEQKIFNPYLFKLNTDAIHTVPVYPPFTHAIFLAKKSLLLKLGFDPFYKKGNGYREESDIQIKAFLNGHKIVVLPSVYCVHMNMSEVQSGGQRVSRLSRFYWSLYYTNYLYNKYYDSLAKKLSWKMGKRVAFTLYTLFEFYNYFIRPFVVLLRSRGTFWKS